MNAILKTVKFDQPWMQALVAEGFTDFRPIMEVSVSLIMILLGVIFEKFDVEDASNSYIYLFVILAVLLLMLVVLEQSYVSAMLRKLERGLEDEVIDSLKDNNSLIKPLMEKNEEEENAVEEVGGGIGVGGAQDDEVDISLKEQKE